MQSTLARRTVATSQEELDAKLELLQQLCRPTLTPSHSSDALKDQSSYLDFSSDQWIQAEYKWALEEAREYASSLHGFDEDEDLDACSHSVYDPMLFSVASQPMSRPSSRDLKSHHPVLGEKDKPLPDIPRASFVRSIPTAPPPSPRTPPMTYQSLQNSEQRSPSSRSSISSRSSTPSRSSLAKSTTPPSSPRMPSCVPSSPKLRTLPRSPSYGSVKTGVTATPDALAKTSAVRHAAYRSISSTLELLEEQEPESTKRSAVYVTDEASDAPVAASRNRSASIGRDSGELIRVALTQASPSQKRKKRPTLPTLSTSSSSPQLRTLASLASSSSSLTSMSTSSTATATPSPLAARPDSPVLHPAPASLLPSSIPFAHGAVDTDECNATLASRWSLDTVASRPTQLASPISASVSASTSTSDASDQAANAAKGRKRDRLMSFISRGRAGSLGKGTPPGHDLPDGRRSVSGEPYIVVASPRPSFSIAPPLPMPPAPLALSASTSTTSSYSSASSSDTSSGSTLPTPIDPPEARAPFQEMDPFSPTSPSMVPFEVQTGSRKSSVAAYSPFPESSEMAPPDMSGAEASRASPPPEPTLPLPSPGMPSPSFLTPQRPQSFFSSLALKRRVRRRQKKLVITGVDADAGELYGPAGLAQAQAQGELALARYHSECAARAESVRRWCESFGAVRTFDQRADGSIHVYWREWEVADMVCRVQAQVIIKEVGRVSLAWHYIN